MKFFVDATNPPADKRPYIQPLAWMLGSVILVMALGQLFAFEKFVPLVESFWLPGGKPAAYLLATLIVVSEVFALPYLIGMRLSPAMRVVSAALTLVVSAIWLGNSLWLNLTVNAVANIGILGVKVSLPVGWWAVFFSLALLVLSVWILWGRRPFSGKVLTVKGAQ